MFARLGSRDDRGQRHPRPADALDWREAGISRVEEVGVWLAQVAAFLAVIVFAGVFWFVAISWFLNDVLDVNRLMGGLILAVLPFLLSMVTGLALVDAFQRWHYQVRLLPLIRRRRLCANCGYEMGVIPTESDGCTICPECGAAWRLAEAPEG